MESVDAFDAHNNDDLTPHIDLEALRTRYCQGQVDFFREAIMAADGDHGELPQVEVTGLLQGIVRQGDQQYAVELGVAPAIVDEGSAPSRLGSYDIVWAVRSSELPGEPPPTWQSPEPDDYRVAFIDAMPINAGETRRSSVYYERSAQLDPTDERATPQEEEAALALRSRAHTLDTVGLLYGDDMPSLARTLHRIFTGEQDQAAGFVLPIDQAVAGLRQEMNAMGARRQVRLDLIAEEFSGDSPPSDAA